MANVLNVDRLTIALPPGSDRPHAVEDVSYSVEAGEIVCVVGESGSGKSVTLKTMIQSMIWRLPPSKVRFIMVDAKTDLAATIRCLTCSHLSSVTWIRLRACWNGALWK